MNFERLNILAEWLEAGAPHKHGVDRFGMDVGVQSYTSIAAPGMTGTCGTACCIAGAATQFFGEAAGKLLLEEAKEDGEATFHPVSHLVAVFPLAAELLDLNEDVANQLFIPDEIDEDDWDKITAAEAAHTIRTLIKTGEVDWSHVDV